MQKTWIAVGAASALGLGVIAGGAVASANEMALTSDDTTVPGLTSTDSSTSGSADVTFDISSDSVVSPAVASVVSPVSVVTPAEVSAASPVSPAEISAASPASPVSVVSPATPASPASVPSAVSAVSAGSAD